jgi:hypothetical protein
VVNIIKTHLELDCTYSLPQLWLVPLMWLAGPRGLGAAVSVPHGGVGESLAWF